MAKSPRKVRAASASTKAVRAKTRVSPAPKKPAVDHYIPQEIETKWQERWEESHIYEAEMDPSRPKFYNLMMYPYPSGKLHMGHVRSYSIADVIARFKRMRGYQVLNPMGWDAFGLPAENAAIKYGIHPREWTERTIAEMKHQFRRTGMSYDWRREVTSFDPEYYRWNQWFFLKMYERGLAYKAKAWVNWCPADGTILANEQVINGRCWRHPEAVVEKRELEQWFLKITAYAEELLEDLKTLEHWPERVKVMQENWIGRSPGVEFEIPVKDREAKVPVFTTRIDTIYGMSFVALAPEHPLAKELTTADHREEVESYIAQSLRATEIDRLSTEREPEGVFIGCYALNPLNGEEVPIYIADYVLITYGGGAVMGVPAHDTRDFGFAKEYGLPIPVVVAPPGWSGAPLAEAYLDEGTMVNSGPFTGLPSKMGMERIADEIERRGIGTRRVQYRLRDWLISRQRYWGTPIPIIYCDMHGIVPVPEEDLPVLLPDKVDFAPIGTGESPLATVAEFVNVTCPLGRHKARRETDTMDTFVDSSWYFLRFTDPRNRTSSFDPQKVGYWMPVDQYTGGIEHAILHLLYARFFTKVLRDIGLVKFDEPFMRLFTHGMVTKDGAAMHTSIGNVVSIDETIQTYGADTGRVYVLFLAPPNKDAEWTDQGIEGPFRFLKRVWSLAQAKGRAKKSAAAERDLLRKSHQTIQQVTKDIEGFGFNTAISAIMELSNAAAAHFPSYGHTPAYNQAMEVMLKLLAPFAPHITEELWERRGHKESIHLAPWPKWDAALAREEKFTLVIQVNGRVRDKVELARGISESEARRLALASPLVEKHLAGKSIDRVIYVPEKLLNIVAH